MPDSTRSPLSKPKLSTQGTVMSQLSGVRAIMKDIVLTLQTAGADLIDLSAGNPVILPEVEALWRSCTEQLLKSPTYGQVICRYGSSRGYEPFIQAIADDFNTRYKLSLTAKNILITPGSQSIYFIAANSFAGPFADGTVKTMLLPLSPDYTGYGSVSLTPESVIALKPNLEIDEGAHRFKYRPNIDALEVNETTGCVVFSRPCNPTGNTISDDEVRGIVAKARPHGVPVFIDSAYAPPFPALNFTEMTPMFGPGIVHCLSLSKAGLPGERIGVAIGNEDTIEALECFQTNACIHSSRYGQAIATLALRSGRLVEIAETVIRPHYKAKFNVVDETLDAVMPRDVPWYLHKGEGAIFAWLWLKDLPVSDWDFYNELKKLGVVIVPGSPFFPGLREEWRHKSECFRISLTATPDELAEGMRRLAGEVRRQYGKS